MAASYDRPAIPAFASMRPGSHAARGIMFKQSPFYEVREALTQPQDLYGKNSPAPPTTHI